MSADVQTAGLADVAQALARGERVVDVREPFEYASGHIPGSEHIPMHLVPLRLQEFPADAPVYLVCASGNRSWQVAAFLAWHGIRAFNVAGGMVAWQAVGNPVTTGVNP